MHPLRHRRSVAFVVFLALAACVAAREEPEDSPTYASDAKAVLSAKCARCHAGPAPAGGWRADSYEDAVCSPVLDALARLSDHSGLLTSEERAQLERGLSPGAPTTRPGVHTASFLEPKSPDGHGNFLRAQSYRPMLDAANHDACGTCHDGAPAKPAGLAYGAPGATSCTSCHSGLGGVLGCETCHGEKERLDPPRNPCFHAGAEHDHTHRSHLESSASRTDGLPCSTCHPQPGYGDIATKGGTHANGFVDVSCSLRCHSRGGARPSPAWNEDKGPMTCNDCHSSPPANHYRGACTSCHREADPSGTALTSTRLHVNGKVDLGDGSGKCGACHGTGDDPWPSTGAHAAHRAPAGAKPVPCETCHDVPDVAHGEKHPLGLGAPVVRLGGLAVTGGRRASYDPTTKSCAGTYCHEGRGATVATPKWTDGIAAGACGSCHSIPPPDPHPQSTDCVQCHQGSLSSTHVDGMVTR